MNYYCHYYYYCYLIHSYNTNQIMSLSKILNSFSCSVFGSFLNGHIDIWQLWCLVHYCAFIVLALWLFLRQSILILQATLSLYDMLSLLRGALGLYCLCLFFSLSAFQGDPLLHQPSTCDAWPPALATVFATLCKWQQPEWGPRSHSWSGSSRNSWPSGSFPCPVTAQFASFWAATQQPWRGKRKLMNCR